MIKKLYPGGKIKAFILSYDDGVTQDVRLVQLINKCNLRATFNLNSYLSETEFQWTHPTGTVVKRLPCNVLSELYRGHEVASHTRSHPYMDNLIESQIMDEMAMDKEALEEICKTKLFGFAVPFEYYSDLIKSCAEKCRFEYARTSEITGEFAPQNDYFEWKPTAFHLDENLDMLIKEFISTQEELALFLLVGHSYDLDTENMWDKTEDIFRLISSQNDILPMTHLELIRYLKAMDTVIITDKTITNPSDITLWFDVDGDVISVNPQMTFDL